MSSERWPNLVALIPHSTANGQINGFAFRCTPSCEHTQSPLDVVCHAVDDEAFPLQRVPSSCRGRVCDRRGARASAAAESRVDRLTDVAASIECNSKLPADRRDGAAMTGEEFLESVRAERDAPACGACMLLVTQGRREAAALLRMHPVLRRNFQSTRGRHFRTLAGLSARILNRS